MATCTILSAAEKFTFGKSAPGTKKRTDIMQLYKIAPISKVLLSNKGFIRRIVHKLFQFL